jgi:hypothetical protein
MRDQVHNLVPSLMEMSVHGVKKHRGRMVELSVFLFTTVGYLVALALTA